MKRRIAVTLFVGAGLGLSGCQAPSLGGLAFWNRNGSAVASTAPDVGTQKYNGLSQQFGNDPHRAMGQSPTGTTAMGAARDGDSENFLTASWKKTTATVSGAIASKPKITAPEDDPLRLDKFPKKIGPEVYVGAARLFENHGQFAEAEEKYREALRAAPTDQTALVGLARLHDRQGQGQKAIETYQKAAQAHPTSGVVFNDLGLCHRRQRQLDQSLAAFRKAVDLQPDNAKYRNNLAGALVEAGRTDEALKELAAVNSPAVAHYNLAHLLEQRSQRPEAIQHLQQALALDPGLAPARDMLNQLAGVATAAPATEAVVPRTAIVANEQPAPSAANSPADYSAYTAVAASVPQAATAAATEPSSYHIGDDSASAANTAQRPNWSSTWLAPAGGGAKTTRPLPPID